MSYLCANITMVKNFFKGIGIFRPHLRPVESESPGLGNWNFKKSLGDCHAHQHLVTGVTLICSCGNKSRRSSGGAWKGSGSSTAICLWVWWPYFPNQKSETVLGTLRRCMSLLCLSMRIERVDLQEEVYSAQEKGVESPSSSLSAM